MPKFYIQTNQSKIIMDASDIECAIRKSIFYMLKHNAPINIIMWINETGFNFSTDTLCVSTVPYLKELEYPLPSDEELLNMAKKILDIDEIEPSVMNWILGYEDEEE